MGCLLKVGNFVVEPPATLASPQLGQHIAPICFSELAVFHENLELFRQEIRVKSEESHKPARINIFAEAFATHPVHGLQDIVTAAQSFYRV